MSSATSAVAELAAALDDRRAAELGASMMAFVEEAYPVPRSLTGNGVRRTLELLQRDLPELMVQEVPTGTPVLDWRVPREWNVREAWIKAPDGSTVVDFADHSLHLLGYSVPVRGRFSLDELQEHLYSLPDQPELIPYRTSYYAERWGFCLPHAQRRSLPEGEYEVLIDATLEDGSLTYGELFLPGRSEHEVLFSAHICHPSLANDNLSGIAVTAALARLLSGLEPSRRRTGYRFLFGPGTIGAITWLARNRDAADRVVHGLVAANLGDPGGFHYKRSRGGTLEGGPGWPVDEAVVRAAERVGAKVTVEDFVPFGYDERQFCSPGFDLPVGLLSRTPWGRFPEYHTSADDLGLLSADRLAESLRLFLAVCAELEGMRRFRNVMAEGEPQLGSRGLYRTLGGDDGGRERELAILWALSLADGRRSTERIAERSGLELERIEEAVEALAAADILVEE